MKDFTDYEVQDVQILVGFRVKFKQLFLLLSSQVFGLTIATKTLVSLLR